MLESTIEDSGARARAARRRPSPPPAPAVGGRLVATTRGGLVLRPTLVERLVGVVLVLLGGTALALAALSGPPPGTTQALDGPALARLALGALLLVLALPWLGARAAARSALGAARGPASFDAIERVDCVECRPGHFGGSWSVHRVRLTTRDGRAIDVLERRERARALGEAKRIARRLRCAD